MIGAIWLPLSPLHSLKRNLRCTWSVGTGGTDSLGIIIIVHATPVVGALLPPASRGDPVVVELSQSSDEALVPIYLWRISVRGSTWLFLDAVIGWCSAQPWLDRKSVV